MEFFSNLNNNEEKKRNQLISKIDKRKVNKPIFALKGESLERS